MEKIARYNKRPEYVCPKFEVEYDVLIDLDVPADDSRGTSVNDEDDANKETQALRETQDFNHLIPATSADYPREKTDVARDGKTVVRDGKTFSRKTHRMTTA